MCFSEEADGVVASHQFRGEVQRSRHFIEFILAMWVARPRSLLGPERLVLQRVSFRHAAVAEPERYRALFGPNVEFNAPVDALVLPRSMMDEPLFAGDPAAAQAFAGHLDMELGRLSTGSSPEAVRAQVVQLMRAGSAEAFDLGAVARRMAVSRRTLQRRSLEEGTSFRDLIDAARRDVALAELSRGASTVTDLAFLLGFSEHSAFSRAFRRWTGKSPVVYLRSAASAAR